MFENMFEKAQDSTKNCTLKPRKPMYKEQLGVLLGVAPKSVVLNAKKWRLTFMKWTPAKTPRRALIDEKFGVDLKLEHFQILNGQKGVGLQIIQISDGFGIPHTPSFENQSKWRKSCSSTMSHQSLTING